MAIYMFNHTASVLIRTCPQCVRTYARTHLPAAQFCTESSQDLSDLDDHLPAKLP